MKLDANSRKRLTYAKYLYSTAVDSLHSTNQLVAAEALLRAHDAIEILQLVVVDKLGASSKFEFMKFWEEVKSRTRREAPYKDQMSRLNHMRVGFKHKAICPNLSELRDVAATVLPFFSEVCREFLGVDFSTLSLAELVDDADVRDRLYKTEGLINDRRYEDALAELAVAFHLVFRRKNSPTGLRPAGRARMHRPGASSSGPPKIHAPHGLPGEASRMVDRINEALEQLYSDYSKQAQLLEMLVWKVDSQRYRRFADFAPDVYEFGSGQFQVRRTDQGRPFTRTDVNFCFQFVLDSALSIQQLKSELPLLYGAQRVKTTVADTVLYECENGAAIAIGQIPKGEELIGAFLWIPGLEAAWEVTWGDTTGFVRNSDVVQVGDE